MNTCSRAKYLCVALLLATLPAIAGEMDEIDKKLAKEAPLFERAKMRGRLRDDVSLDVVKQTPGDGYQLRVVDWWPKKGVDLIENPKGEPRTWTISQKKPINDAKWWPKTLRGKKQFKAHLLGFRGMGAANNVWGDVTKPLTPAVVLRLPDGRKRCFGRGAFTDEDEKYIADLYEEQMKVLRDNTFEEGFERIFSSHDNVTDELSDNPLYTPGTAHISSKHFTATLGSEPPDHGRSKWLDANDKEGAARNRKLIMRGWEDWWSYLEHGGHLMFFSEKLGPKYKYAFQIGLTKKDGKNLGGGFGGGYGACGGGDGNWWGLYHEWGHGIPSGAMQTFGGGEALCDSGQLIGDPAESTHKCYFQIMKPWKSLFHGWYPAGYTWNVIGDDPNWGYVFPYTITRMMSDSESTPMHVIARVGEKRGLFKNGIRGVGDLLGQVGARFAEFDNELQQALRREFTMPTRVRLLEIDRKENRYRSDPVSAPEAFGVNIIRLVPDANATKLTVDFEGHYDPEIYSDWRVCIVAVDKDGICRYSPLWNKGKMSMKTQPGDMRYWLTVTAAPTALSPTQGNKGQLSQQTAVVYQGAFAYRYPYDVVLKGCHAGSPHSTPVDDETLGQGGLKAGRRHGTGINVASIPVTDPEQRQHVEEVLAAMGDHKAAKWHLNNMKGKRHPNGGGWVADTATADKTAYVGPNAMVLDEAKVLDDAVIEDYVIVYGNAVFKDNARGYGKLAVNKGVFSKDARMYRRTDLNVDLKRPKTLLDNVDAPQKRYAQFFKVPPIQANFDMFHPEATLLEDHFNERLGVIFGAHTSDRLFFDGVLIGNPGFTYDDVETGAVTFNGKDQWAEMPGEMADLEVITVDVRFKVDSTKQQTVWMFGNDASSQLSLSVAGGELELLGQGGGKQADCRGGKVVSDQWTTVRAELDGTTIRLFQDGKNIVEVKTAFRASDAFTPGKVRMAKLGAGFSGATPMAGAVDYLRFFTEVLDDFENIEIPLMNPRRLCPRTLARFDAKFPSSAVKQLHFREQVARNHPLALYYEKYVAGLSSRLDDLARMSDRVQALEDQIDTLASRRQENARESRDAKGTDKVYQALRKESGQKLEALRQKRNATLFLHPGHKEAYDKREVMSATLRKRREEVQAELKKTPAFTALLEKLEKGRKKVDSMYHQQHKDYLKENKRVQELDAQKWRMIQAGMGAKADELQREVNRYGATVEEQKALAKNTPEWIEVDKQYRELEEKLRYKPDPKFAEELKQIDETIKKAKEELEILKVASASEINPYESFILRHSLDWGMKISGKITAVVLPGLLPKPFDHAPHLEAARKLQNRPWPTTVDWDGRADYEKNKDAVAQPIMQHYLKRMKPWMYK